MSTPLLPDGLWNLIRGRQFDPGSFWGRQTGPNPTDRAKLGRKRHVP